MHRPHIGHNVTIYHYIYPGRESNPVNPKPKTRGTARRCAVSVAEAGEGSLHLVPSSSLQFPLFYKSWHHLWHP